MLLFWTLMFNKEVRKILAIVWNQLADTLLILNLTKVTLNEYKLQINTFTIPHCLTTVLYIPVLSVNAKGSDFALKAEKYNIQRYYLLIYFYTFHQETIIRLCNGSISNLVKMQSATTSVEKSKI